MHHKRHWRFCAAGGERCEEDQGSEIGDLVTGQGELAAPEEDRRAD